MRNARNEGKPRCKKEMAELIREFEESEIPARFQQAYLGSIQTKIKGNPLTTIATITLGCSLLMLEISHTSYR